MPSLRGTAGHFHGPFSRGQPAVLTPGSPNVTRLIERITLSAVSSPVSRVLIILLITFGLDVIWLIVSSRIACGTRWRYLNAAFVVVQIGALAWLVLGRFSGSGWDRALPKAIAAALVIWHMILLPILIIIIAIAGPIVGAIHLIRWIRARNRREPAGSADSFQFLTRREFLGITTAAVPPLLTVGLTTVALQQLANFRVRRLQLPIVGLPPDLHGMTIAQVSDMHVGRFTSGRILRDMVAATNSLRADLVLLTGDLINDALADLDHGLELAHQMQARVGVYIIEGNHDLIENGPEFERRVKASGIPFLLDDSLIVNVGGTPVQLLGLSWTRTYENRDAAIYSSVTQLLTQRRNDAFPILLAHHPHAFDAAADARVPLTLSGHTHGGQLMLNERCGFGPAMFRYWSGLYTRGASNLIVSNGVGNWFPLRVNAPAEIIHLTLVRL